MFRAADNFIREIAAFSAPCLPTKGPFRAFHRPFAVAVVRHGESPLKAETMDNKISPSVLSRTTLESQRS